MKAKEVVFGLFLVLVSSLSIAQEPVYPSIKRESEPEGLDFYSPKEIIKKLDSTERYIPGASRRTVDDYKKRINDPARRFKLNAVSPGTKCDVCDMEGMMQRNAEEEFYIRSADDKILITLFNKQDKATYVDLPPNSVYGIYMETFSLGGGGLPKSTASSDIRQWAHSGEEIKVYCAPKLSELGDEYYINNIYFDFGRSELSKDALRELDRMAIVAIKNPNVTFLVDVYADERDMEDGQKRKLLNRRLEKIMAYIERRGVNTDRVIGHTHISSVPLIDGAATEDEHRLNRCATIRLVNRWAQNIKYGDSVYPVAEMLPPCEDRVSFTVQLGSFAFPLDEPMEYFADVLNYESGLDITYYMGEDGYYKYNVGGVFADLDEARALVRRILEYRECYIAAFYKGQRITVYEAQKVLEHNRRIGDAFDPREES